MNGTFRFHSRDFSRRAAIRYMRIEEVRDYLDTFLTAFRKLMSLRRGAMYSWKCQHRVEVFEEILRLLEAAVNKRFHLYLLNDAVPSDLDGRLIQVIRGKPGRQTEQDFNRDLLLENMSAEPD